MAYKPVYSFLLFLIFSIFSNSNKGLCFASEENPSSLVLSLRSSRTDLPSGKASPWWRRKTLEMQDMVEPLREVRDGYLMSLNIGTPSQVIQAYLDTGSDLTWVPCGNLSFNCMNCDDYRNTKLNAAFSPSYSTTTLRDACSSPFCIDVHSSDNPYDTCIMAGCSLSSILNGMCEWPCPSFAYTYGAGGIVTGTLTRDTIRVHNVNPNVLREIPEFAFGCVGSTYHEPIGLAGFGRGSLSLPSQLGFLQQGFSHCFLAFKYANNPNMSSPLVIGDVAIAPKEGQQFTPMLKCPIYPNYYYIGLEGITVGNAGMTTVPHDLREFDSQGNGGLLIDSGTTYTHLPEFFYSQLLSILESVISYPRAKEVEARSGFDLCYRVPCPDNTNPMNDELPPITFHFLNNVSLALPHGNSFYPMGAPSNSSVVKCLLFQSMDDGDGPAGVFGSFQQQNVEVVYDLENGRVGFQPMDCAVAASSKGLLHKG